MTDGTQIGGVTANEQGMFFAENVSQDRVVNETGWGLWLAASHKPGVVNGYLNSLIVTATGPATLAVDVDTGGALVGPTNDELAGYLKRAKEAHALATADPTNGRIDLIGVAVRRALAHRHIGVEVITGTPAGSPVRPTIGSSYAQDKDEFFMELAEISVPATDTTIEAGQITDTRTFANAKGVTTRRSMWFPGSSLKPPIGAAGPSAGEFSSNWDANILSFDQTTDESAFGSFILPPEWDGVFLQAKVYWVGGGSGGDVIWALDLTGVADDELLTAALTEAGVVTDTRTLTNDLQITGPIVWDGSTPALAAEEVVQFAIRRDASAGGDTIGADVDLLGLTIEFDTFTP